MEITENSRMRNSLAQNRNKIKGRASVMKLHWVVVLLALACFSVPASAQEMKMGDKSWNDLEKTLEDVNLQWLCAGKYYKPKAQDCVNFRAQYWADQFFEMGANGLQTKAQMVAGQTASAKIYPDVAEGEGPNPTQFKLMAVYNNGNFAMAYDRTLFKVALNKQGQPDFEHSPTYLHTDHLYPDGSGRLMVTREVIFMRLFVKENGKWRPAAGASIPLPPAK
jgi:hypothetical protein